MKIQIPPGDNPLGYEYDHKIRSGRHTGDWMMKDGIVMPNDDANLTCWIHHTEGSASTTHRERLRVEVICWIVCCEPCAAQITTAALSTELLLSAIDRAMAGGYYGANPNFVALRPRPAKPVPPVVRAHRLDRTPADDVLAAIDEALTVAADLTS